jgi:hypothetical protein
MPVIMVFDSQSSVWLQLLLSMIKMKNNPDSAQLRTSYQSSETKKRTSKSR